MAPMPFLIGMPASIVTALQAMRALEEVVLVDLDLGAVYVPPALQHGAPGICSLPWADRLENAFAMVRASMRSPSEFESTPLIAHIMQVLLLPV